MTGPAPVSRLRASPSVCWVTDRRCTLVVSETRGEVLRLTGVPEVVWDCLVLGMAYARIQKVVAELRHISETAAGDEIDHILREWQELGLVEMEDRHG